VPQWKQANISNVKPRYYNNVGTPLHNADMCQILFWELSTIGSRH